MTIFGWDVSAYDHERGSLDMVRAKTEGVRFVSHRVSIGDVYLDSPGWTLSRAWDADVPFIGGYMVVRTPGSPGGNYTRAKANGSVETQVGLMLDHMAAQAPWFLDFPGAFWQVDSEHWTAIGGVRDDVAVELGHEACDMLHAATGLQVFHYAPRWSYGDTVPGAWPLWASNYVLGSGTLAGLYPGDTAAGWAAYSGRAPAILQYSARATIAGQQPSDANAYRGTEDDFRHLIAREGGSMPTAAQLHSETWWQREIVTDEARWVQQQLCSRTNRPLDAFGCKGNDAHLNGSHRSQEWIKNSAYCTNHTYTVQSGLTAEQARHCAGIDWTPGSADAMIAQCKRIYAAMVAGQFEECVEFFGNIDGDKVVDGWQNIANRTTTSDSSHLWHWHAGMNRMLMTSMDAMRKLVGIALGDIQPGSPITITPKREVSMIRVMLEGEIAKTSKWGNGAVYLTDGTTGDRNDDGTLTTSETTHIGPDLNDDLNAAGIPFVKVGTEQDLHFLNTYAMKNLPVLDVAAVQQTVREALAAAVESGAVSAVVDPVALDNALRAALDANFGKYVLTFKQA